MPLYGLNPKPRATLLARSPKLNCPQTLWSVHVLFYSKCIHSLSQNWKHLFSQKANRTLDSPPTWACPRLPGIIPSEVGSGGDDRWRGKPLLYPRPRENGREGRASHMWLPSTQNSILIYKARLAFPGFRSNVGGEALLPMDFGIWPM